MFTAVPTKAIGDVFTADPMWNQYLRDNLNKGVVRPIVETTLAAPAASIDFTAIAADWSHLLLVIEGRSSVAALTDSVRARFNNDSTAVYNWQQFAFINATVSGGPSLGQTGIVCLQVPGASASASVDGGGEVLIPNYAGTTFHKSVRSSMTISVDDTATNQHIQMFGGRWRSTAAINRITLSLTSGSNFAIGSKATLYGMGGI